MKAGDFDTLALFLQSAQHEARSYPVGNPEVEPEVFAEEFLQDEVSEATPDNWVETEMLEDQRQFFYQPVASKLDVLELYPDDSFSLCREVRSLNGSTAMRFGRALRGFEHPCGLHNPVWYNCQGSAKAHLPAPSVSTWA